MLSRANSVTWLAENNEIQNNNNNNNMNNHNNNNNNNQIHDFKSLLEIENEWYHNNNNELNRENIIINQNQNQIIIENSSSSHCSPSNPNFYCFPSKTNFFTNPLTQTFNLGENVGFFQNNSEEILDLGGINRGNCGVLGGFNGGDFNCNTDLIFSSNGGGSGSGFRGFEDGLLLKPLDNSIPEGAQPTLFQKRAALRKNVGEKKRKGSGLDSVSFDGSGFGYDSDEFTENNGDQSEFGSGLNGNGNGGGNGNGNGKGKKKGLPAKNLMAERRRRKKLNDRLYMLRSVVPKISKMDRASILGDAIEYLKELLQKINDLHNELESSPPASTLSQTTNFHPLTPTLPNLPSRIKEELCPSSLPSPNGQPARIEVRLREGRAVNIHMFCGRRPGLLLSTMRALDGLGLDIQQAVISCFNGFAMDIFRAEQCKDGQDVHPEQIKALLTDLATYHGSNIVGNCSM